MMSALRGDERIGLTGGDQEIDLVHVSDVCRAFEMAGMLLLEDSGPDLQPYYGVSSGRRISVRQLAALLEDVAGKKMNAAWGERPYRKCEVMRLQNGYASLPGWRPMIPLEAGLRALWSSAQ